jgi:cytochrome c556
MLKTIICALTAASVVGGASIAAANDDPDAAIKYRKDAMASVGAHTKALVAILKGEIDHTDGLALHANGLAAAAHTGITIRAFQQNTSGEGVEKTTSTAKIWEDWARFEKALKDLETAALAIQTSAAAGELTSFDQLKPALKECGFCHRDSGFREK